jgi:hypothetical protein
MATGFALTGCLSATLVNYNPAPTTDTGWNPCGATRYPTLEGNLCKTTAFFEAMSLDQEFMNNPGGISVIFGAAFNAWNTRDNVSYNPLGVQRGWTLSFGGDPGGTFNVSTAKALQRDNLTIGAANIVVTPSDDLLKTMNGKLGANDVLVWVQGLYLNWNFSGDALPAFYEMDVDGVDTTNKGRTDPSYCASFPGAAFPCPTFSDLPATVYLPLGVQDFFYANAYLAIENRTNKTLTVYDGIDYGFNNYVDAPEPLTWPLLGVGLALIGYLVGQAHRRCCAVASPPKAENS